MFPLSKRMLIVTSIGHAVLLSLALSGAAKIISGLLGTPISPDTGNTVFLVSVLITAPPFAYFKIARLMLPADLQRAASQRTHICTGAQKTTSK